MSSNSQTQITETTTLWVMTAQFVGKGYTLMDKFYGRDASPRDFVGRTINQLEADVLSWADAMLGSWFFLTEEECEADYGEGDHVARQTPERFTVRQVAQQIHSDAAEWASE